VKVVQKLHNTPSAQKTCSEEQADFNDLQAATRLKHVREVVGEEKIKKLNGNE
jgi:hypothetical protein